MKRYILVILLLRVFTLGAFTPDDDLAKQYARQYDSLERLNDENERLGNKSLNRYIIELNANWIEEMPVSYLKQDYNKLSTALSTFNTSRKDNLRFYVVVINGYYARLKQTLTIEQLPKGTMNDLFKIIKYTAKSTRDNDVSNFTSNTDKVISRIEDSFDQQHYGNRIIYCFSVVRLHDGYLGDRVTTMLTDNMIVRGPKLKSKEASIRQKAIASRSANSSIKMDIVTAVYNVIGAVRLVVDGGVDNDPALAATGGGCGLDLNESIERTRPIRDSSYTTSIGRLARFFDDQRNQGADFVMYDNPSTFPKDKDMLFHFIMPDKMQMLSSGYSKYKAFIVFKQINFAMPASDWPQFANDFYNKSVVAQQIPEDNLLLIVVPYYMTTCKVYTNEVGLLLFPGVYCPSNKNLEGEMNAAFALGSTLTEVKNSSFKIAFNEAIKRIPKRYHAYSYSLLWNGSLVAHDVIDKTDMVGYENMSELQMRIDRRYDEYKNINNMRCCESKHRSTDGGDIFTQEEINKMLIDLGNSEPKYEYVTTTNLIQSKLSDDVAFKFSHWMAARETDGKFSASLDSPPGDWFYDGRNLTQVMDNLDMLNKLSMAASLIGLDWVFNGAASIYALENGLYEEAVFNAGFAIPLSSLAKPLAKGSTLLPRTAAGKFVLLPAELAKGAPTLFHELSSLLNLSLNGEALVKARQYAANEEFIALLEQGIVKADGQADARILEILNKDPEWIDDFYQAQKEGKIELGVFLDSELNGTLLDATPATPFSQVPGIHVASLGKDKDVLLSLQRIKPETGWFDVIVHGTPDHFMVLHNGNWVAITHRDLYNYLKRMPGFADAAGVRLISCEAGLKDLAENFAKKAKKKVRAANVKIGVTESGDIVSHGGAGWWSEYSGTDWTVSFENGAGSSEKKVIPAASTSDVAVYLGYFDDVAVESETYRILKEDATYKNWFDQYFNKEKQRVYQDIMPLEEEVALQWYVRQGPALNGKIRDQEALSEFEKALIQTINDGLDKLEGFSGTVYRGVSVEEFNFLVSKVEHEGGIVTFNDFKSTSKSQSVALTFNPAPGGPKYLEIFETGGGIDISATRTAQEEVLFKQNGKFKIKIDPEEDGVVKIHLMDVNAVVKPDFDGLISSFKQTNPDPAIAKIVDDAKATGNTKKLEDLFSLKARPVDVEIAVSGNAYDAKLSNLLKKTDVERETIRLSESERAIYEVKVKNGKLYQNGNRLDLGEDYMFVMAADGRVYARQLRDIPSQFAHSSFLGDEKIVTAGSFKLDVGSIQFTNASGHFKPAEETLQNVVQEFTSRGVKLQNMEYGEIQRLITSIGPDGGLVIYTSDLSSNLGSGTLKDGYLTLSINVKALDGGDPLGRGSDVFEEIYKGIVNKHGAEEIKGIRGLWTNSAGYSDNIDTFNKLILEQVNTGKMTLEQAALETFTGKMAKRKEFTKVTEIKGLKNSDNTYTVVSSILFSKP
jgi:hypothetical protein